MWQCDTCGYEKNDGDTCEVCVGGRVYDYDVPRTEVLHSALAPDEAMRTLIECFCGPSDRLGAAAFRAFKGRGGRRPKDMTGWRWSQVPRTAAGGDYVFRVSSSKEFRLYIGITVTCEVTPDDGEGSLVRITWPGVVGSRRAVPAMETRLLRSELRTSEHRDSRP